MSEELIQESWVISKGLYTYQIYTNGIEANTLGWYVYG